MISRLHGAFGRIMVVLALLIVVLALIPVGAWSLYEMAQANAAPARAASVARPIHSKPKPTATVLTEAELRASVVQIESTWSAVVNIPTKRGVVAVPASYSSECTAWFVAAGNHPTLVTSTHCIDDPDYATNLSQMAWQKLGDYTVVPSSSWEITGDVGEVSTDVQIKPTLDSIETSGRQPTTLKVFTSEPTDEGDLAILQATHPLPHIRPLKVAKSNPGLLEPVTSIGYPSGMIESSKAAYLEASFKTGTVSSRQVAKNGVAFTEVSSPLGHGMSGGPTVNAAGEVVGVNMMVTDYQPFNAITDTRDLRSYLKEYGPGSPTFGLLSLK